MNRFLPLEMEEGEIMNEDTNLLEEIVNEDQTILDNPQQQKKRRCSKTNIDETQALVLHTAPASQPTEFSIQEMAQLLVEHSHQIQSMQLHIQHLEMEIQILRERPTVSPSADSTAPTSMPSTTPAPVGASVPASTVDSRPPPPPRGNRSAVGSNLSKQPLTRSSIVGPPPPPLPSCPATTANSATDEWRTQTRHRRKSMPHPTASPPSTTPLQEPPRRQPRNALKSKVRSLLPPLPRAVDESAQDPALTAESRIQLLFDSLPNSTSSMSSDPSPNPQTRPVICVRVKEDRFSPACRRAPKEAWRLLLRELARPQQMNWDLFDILPISPVEAEIYLPHHQLESFQSAMGKRMVDHSLFQLQEKDLKRRLAAYRMGYFKELRLAALQDLSPALQVRLLEEAVATPPTTPTRHRNIQASARHDLATLTALPETRPLDPAMETSAPPPLD
jgi:hypothetical protein